MAPPPLQKKRARLQPGSKTYLDWAGRGGFQCELSLLHLRDCKREKNLNFSTTTQNWTTLASGRPGGWVACLNPSIKTKQTFEDFCVKNKHSEMENTGDR